MSDCERFELEAAAYAEGALDAEAEERMKAHARECPDCRRRLAEVDELLAGTASVRGDIRAVMETIDWEALPEAITGKAFAAAERRTRESRPGRFPTFARVFRWSPLLAAALVGAVVGAGGMFLLLRNGGGSAGSPPGLSASGESIALVESGLARQETLEYLDRSQTVLLELVQNGTSGPRPPSRAAAVEAARALVTKKRYLNSQLDSVPLAKARTVCDQIEVLFIELGRIGETLTPAEAAQIREYIERKQLLLKIRLLRSELAESEV
jgi:hypothetical protein